MSQSNLSPGVSVFVYIFEMVDVCQTLKYDEENVFYARLAKSMVLALEEVRIMRSSRDARGLEQKRVICPGRVMCSSM